MDAVKSCIRLYVICTNIKLSDVNVFTAKFKFIVYLFNKVISLVCCIFLGLKIRLLTTCKIILIMLIETF